MEFYWLFLSHENLTPLTLSGDEAILDLTGHVEKHNSRYWSDKTHDGRPSHTCSDVGWYLERRNHRPSFI